MRPNTWHTKLAASNAQSAASVAAEVGADLPSDAPRPPAPGLSHAISKAGTPPPVALSQAGLQVRCMLWLLAVCAIDFSTSFSFLLMVCSCLLDLWFISRLAAPGQGIRAVFTHLKQRLRSPPPQVLIFAGIVLMNLALEHILVEAVSRPFLFNNLLFQSAVLLWACLVTPNQRAARGTLHRWATLFVCALGTMLLVQVVLYGGLGYNFDIRELLTGQASRSGLEEGTEGERPTAIFVEPSCLAISVFTLNFVARLTGPRQVWLTAVTALTCLLNNSGIGLFLALFLLVEEAVTQLKQHLVLVPVIVMGLTAMVWLAASLEMGEFKLHALDQIFRPSTNYDPISVRMYVPLRILHFDSLEHIIGSGIANFAAFKDGITQYDSSFALGVYYQIGLLGVPILLLTLYSAWRAHSFSAFLTMGALFATKMALQTPPFWALVALLYYRKAVAPPATSERKQRPPPPAWSGLMLQGRIAYGKLSANAAAANGQPAWRQISALRLVRGAGQNGRFVGVNQLAQLDAEAGNADRKLTDFAAARPGPPST
jgi:hypothetical protein